MAKIRDVEAASSHTPPEDRGARLPGAGRGYHEAKRSYLVTSTKKERQKSKNSCLSFFAAGGFFDVGLRSKRKFALASFFLAFISCPSIHVWGYTCRSKSIAFFTSSLSIRNDRILRAYEHTKMTSHAVIRDKDRTAVH